MTADGVYRAIEARVAEKLPEFSKAVQGEAEIVVMHQDAFALELQDDEMLLLGMAIKVAGHYGKEVQIIAAKL
jgi:hypothetical protein